MKIPFLIAATSMSLLSFGQQTNKPDQEYPMFTRGIGVSFQAFDGLNSRIANRPEYKKLRDATGTLSLGCMKIYKGFTSNVDVIAGSSMSGDRDRKSSTIRYLGAGFEFGYDVIPSKKIILAPLAGIGVQAYQARFFKDNAAVPFDLVLNSSDVQNGIRPVDFINTFFVYRLGFALATVKTKDPSCTFGLQARYIGSFKNKAWKSADNQELAGAPTDKISQFQVSLVTSGMPRFMRGKW